MMRVGDLINDRFSLGFYFTDDGTVRPDSDPEIREAPFFPLRYEGQKPVYSPMRQRIIDHAESAIVCPRCMQATWAVTRHAVEVHGDRDVTVLPPAPNARRPEWMPPDWI